MNAHDEKPPLDGVKRMSLIERIFWGAIFGGASGLPLGLYSVSGGGGSVADLIIPILIGAGIISLFFVFLSDRVIRSLIGYISKFPW